jgi:dimethylamine monooxygenase subunit A
MHSPLHALFLEANTVEASENCASYFPLENGKYQVKPGFIPFGLCLGNGEADKQVFQIDSNFSHYRQVKLLSRTERLSKYYQSSNYSDTVAGAVAYLMIHRLIQEHPQYFQSESLADGHFGFHCHITRETLYLDTNWHLQQVKTQNNTVFPPYASTLDALAAQVQEDITVIRRSPEGSNWLSAVHLCYPNHWSAEEKIGRDFSTIHAPVAGMEKLNQRSHTIVNAMIVQKPMVRFAWGLSTDTRLNHHPEPPPNVPLEKWQGRQFNRDNPRLFLRIERQVIWGLPEYDAALFTVRTYFRDCLAVKKNTHLRRKLSSALQSMTPGSLLYKGLIDSRDSILAWLEDENKV